MTRQDRFQATTEWMQAALAQDEDLFTEIMPAGVQALMVTLAECYVQGVSTRKVASICQELLGDELSHETVSRYTARRDAVLEPWRTRRESR